MHDGRGQERIYMSYNAQNVALQSSKIIIPPF